MLTIDCDGIGIARTRVVLSPAHEVIGWLLHGLLGHPHPSLGHLRSSVFSASSDPDVQHLVQTLDVAVRNRTVPSFLVPVRGRVSADSFNFAEQLDQIAGLAPEEVQSGLVGMSQDRNEGVLAAARQVRQRSARPEPVSGRTAHRFAIGMSKFWRVAVEPQWPVIGASLRASARSWASTWISQGVEGVFNSIGSQITWTNSSVRLDIAGPSETHHLADRSLMLIPSALAPRSIVDICRTPTPWLAVPVPLAPRSGRLTAELVGSTRAALLSALRDPSTTSELSSRFGLSKATVSFHLSVLLRAGLVDRSREGKHVRYLRRR